MVRNRSGTSFLVSTHFKSTDYQAFNCHKQAYNSMYLLAMLDYISRKNDVPLCSDYNDLRQCGLKKTIYPASVLAMCAATKSEKPKHDAMAMAIPEFKRFNIVECEVRNVI